MLSSQQFNYWFFKERLQVRKLYGLVFKSATNAPEKWKQNLHLFNW